jgi:two-component system chemotaxis response regulator CheY
MNQPTRTILVVDDSTTVRQIIKMTLSMHFRGTLLEAGDGIAALELLRATPVDLVITDINMPNMNGLQLVRTIREDLKLQVAVIVITTCGAEADREEGLRLGANAYLTKPFSGANLMSVIKGLGLA